MKQDLQFRISSGLKNIIGRELITDDFIAIFELVKNSFDAHATEVEIVFENIKTDTGKIYIVDNGKGMDYDDLINKWLFVAYSAKKDGSEDNDYRSKISSKTYYAGAKGIGRFSCDKLGKKLRLISTKNTSNPKTEELVVDWTKFEQNTKDEFINVTVDHNTLTSNPTKHLHGTSLEIFDLRSDSIWNEDKLIRLKNSLAKLINPFEEFEKRPFKIILTAKEFEAYDINQSDTSKKINGVVENRLLEILKIKTTKIISKISEDGKLIITELSNNGNWLYKITEQNIDFVQLKDILIELYFLDQRGKINFTKLMGIRAGDYGSVFLFKNGIRIYPFGEPGEDSFALDKRQSKRLGDYVGTRDLIGRIEVLGENEEFKETTSRGDGLIKNSSYEQLHSFFIDKVISKIESFRRNIVKYGIDIDEFETTQHSEEKIIRLIADITSSDNIISIEFNENLLEIITKTQEDNSSTQTIIKSIEKIAKESNNRDLYDKISKVKITLNEAIIIADLAEEEIKNKDKELKEKQTQNLFLKSIKSQDLDEVVSFMHSIGIAATTIDNYLSSIYQKLNRGMEISAEELKKAIQTVSFENRKIISITRFSTKANFKLFAEDVKLDLVEYIKEYITNILIPLRSEDIYITIEDNFKNQFTRTFKPIELSIMIDNFLSNSIRAKATSFNVSINKNSEENLEISFKDDGIGIPDENINKIFDFGFTTTSGSGLGLYHVNDIIKKINGNLHVDNKQKKGVKFILTIT